MPSGGTPGMSATTTSSSGVSRMSTGGWKYAPGRVVSRRSTFCFGLASSSLATMCAPSSRGLDLNPARPRFLCLGYGDGEDAVPNLRLRLVGGDAPGKPQHTSELALAPLAAVVGGVLAR